MSSHARCSLQSPEMVDMRRYNAKNTTERIWPRDSDGPMVLHTQRNAIYAINIDMFCFDAGRGSRNKSKVQNLMVRR